MLSAVDVLALDPATKTGVAFGRAGQKPQLWTENFGSEDATCEDIYARATLFLADFLRTHPVGLFVIEGVVPPSGAKGFTNHNTTMITVGLFAIFVGIARCKRIPWRRVTVSSWRKHFLGSGRMKTDEAKRAAVKRCRMLGWHPPDHNAADAAGMWDWGCSQLRSPSFEGLQW
ncbi:MAG TPA: hypothetical protein VFX37_09730 [Pseudolabrys sp.]|nr:hypothetical protein [Pseudolabrys sp.]